MKRVKEQIHYWCEDTKSQRLSGKGITAAVFDTGVAPHPELIKRIIACHDCIAELKTPYDDNGHGTHVAGILAADGSLSSGENAGIAPGIRICPVKVLDRMGNGKIRQVIEGIQFVLQYRRKYNIRIVNISIGTLPNPGDREELLLLRWIDRLWEAGIVVVAAAGNLGPDSGSITLPGCSRSVITVGAAELPDMLTVPAGMQKIYSGCGPTAECVLKPDLIAPGENIFSCNSRMKKTGKSYVKKSGTSMATPIVAGAAALLLEKYPYMTNNEVKMKLWESSDDIGLPGNRQGHGMLNVSKLLS